MDKINMKQHFYKTVRSSLYVIILFNITTLYICKGFAEDESYKDKSLQDKSYNDKFYYKKAEGWHWYEDRAKSELTQSEENTKPFKSVETLRKEAEVKLNTAISNPTDENVKAYMLIQKQIIDQSSLFSNIWKKLVYMNPELDATVTEPSAQYGVHLKNDLQNQQKKEKITKLAKEFGLFYFYKNDCPYCNKFTPLVKTFAKQYNFSLLPISMDGKISSELVNSKIDNGISETLEILQVPALIAVNTATGDTIPLAHGLVSLDEIEERAFFLITEQSKQQGQYDDTTQTESN